MSVMNIRPTPAAPGGGPDRPLLVFPGQGSQRAGMAAHLVEGFPDQAVPVLEHADRVLGMPMSRLCASGDARQLAGTEVAQPAILATSLATLAVLREQGVNPAAVAGHSLGEYTALVASGVLTADSALLLVRRRSELMATVGTTTPGAMVAIVGLDAARVEELCAASADRGVVEVANYNEPRQTVVSGQADAVEEVSRLAAEQGADRITHLDVSAPFHCGLMRAIEDEFAAELDRHTFRTPRTPVISSVSGERVRTGDESRALLRRQLAEPVLWTRVLEAARTGFTVQVEVGPGRVLSGLANRAGLGIPTRSTNDARRLRSATAVRPTQGPAL